MQNFLVAVVVPDPANIKAWAEEHGVSEQEVLTGKDFKAAIL